MNPHALVCIGILLAAACAAAPQKILLVAGSEGNYTAQGLGALGIEHDRVAPGEYARTSPFDYDVVIWGMDETRAPLGPTAEAIHAFVRSGGVLLGFRQNDADTWLPVPVQRDKAYAFGEILAPEHPVFNSPHALDQDFMTRVHGGSIYNAFWDLGEGWVPLVSTGREQGWDQREARHDGPHWGIIELEHGRGHIILSQMIPEYHWFHGRGGDPQAEGALLFENLVRYAMSRAPARAATRPPRVVPEGFHRDLSGVMGVPGRREGMSFEDGEWEFSAHGPFSMKTDRRGVLTFTHEDKPSVAGSFAQATRTVDLPADAASVALRWYTSDTYCGGRERVLGGAEHGQTALMNFKADMRYSQVLVNGQVVWEEDVLGRNPQPARDRVRMADITGAVRAADGACEVTLRVEDRTDSGEEPFAIDVFWGAVEVFGDMLQRPAVEVCEAEGFSATEEGLLLEQPQGTLTHRWEGPAGRYALAVRLRDDVEGRSQVIMRADGENVAAWELTADDFRTYWAVTPVAELRAGSLISLLATRDGEDSVLISELAVIPERLLAPPEGPQPRPPAHGTPVERASFPVTVRETAGTAREGEVAFQGLPFPPGALREGGVVRVTDARGAALPVQTRTIARWPDGSVKVALVCFPVTVEAGGEARFTVEAGQGVRAGPQEGALSITERDGLLWIDTGEIRAALSTTHGRIVEEVRRGEELLKGADDVWDLALEDEEGRVVRSGGPTVAETQVVDGGPLRALIVRTGAFADAEGNLVDYRLQLEATAGSEALGLEAVIINREETPEVYLRRWSMDLAGEGAGAGRVWLSEEESRATNPGAVLYQHREDRLTWTGEDGARSRAEGRAPGSFRLPGVAVGTRWFWERFPQAIRFGADGLRMDFIPQAHDEEDLPTRWRDRMLEMTDRYSVGGVGYPQSPGKMGLFRLAQGEALHQELRFVFDGAETGASVREALAPLAARLRAAPEPEHTAATLAFGEFHPRAPLRFPRYEATADRLHDGWHAKRETRREYGFENFGDDTFEWGYGPSYTFWSNSEYDRHHGFALQYLRSGEPRWFELCEQTARHYRDVVICHHAPPERRLKGGPRHHNAVTVWMPQHEEQYWIADHTMAGASTGHSWAEGMVDYWFLTGDPWAEEVVRGLAEWYCDVVRRNAYGAGGQERGPGWTLIAVSALANALGEEEIMEAGRTVAEWIVNYQDPIRGVISIPISEQPSYEGGTSFMHGIVGRGLGRWYDVTGDERVREALLGIAEWLTTEPMGPMGRFWYKQSPQNSRRYGADSQVLNALTYAYRVGGDPWFADVALALFEQTGAGSRTIAWYPQALAHLAPLLTPAHVTVRPEEVVLAPDQAGEVVVEVRNTTEGSLGVRIAARGPEGITCTPPERLEIGGGQAATAAVGVRTATAPARGSLTITVTLTTAEGEETVREMEVGFNAVERLVRLEIPAGDGAEVTAPMVLEEHAEGAFVHTPRGADFAATPQPQDGISGGHAQWRLDAPLAGEYVLWAECKWLDREGDSFYVSVNGGPEHLLGNVGAIGSWLWVEGPRVVLRAGENVIRIRNRECGSQLRRLRLSNMPGDAPG